MPGSTSPKAKAETSFSRTFESPKVWSASGRRRPSAHVAGEWENVNIDGMTSHGVEGVNNSQFVIRNLEVSRCGGSGVRSAAATINFAIENSVSGGNNFGFEAIVGNLRIANCGMFFNNTNCSAECPIGREQPLRRKHDYQQSDAWRHDHPLSASEALNQSSPAPAIVRSGSLFFHAFAFRSACDQPPDAARSHRLTLPWCLATARAGDERKRPGRFFCRR